MPVFSCSRPTPNIMGVWAHAVCWWAVLVDVDPITREAFQARDFVADLVF